MRLINWANYDPTAHIGEVNNLPSLTVPGMTLGLKELLQRFVRGDNVTTFQPSYLGDDSDMPDVSRMNTMERIEMAAEIKQAIKRHQYQSNAKPSGSPIVEDPKPSPGAEPPVDAPAAT